METTRLDFFLCKRGVAPTPIAAPNRPWTQYIKTVYLTKDWVVWFFTDCFKVSSIVNACCLKEVKELNNRRETFVYLYVLLDTGEAFRTEIGLGSKGEERAMEIAKSLQQKNPSIFASDTVTLPNNETLTVPKDNEEIIA